MRVEKIDIRVHIEGILCPYVSSASVQTFANETSRASIVVPPIPGFETEELTRARVHIYWSDIDIRNHRTSDDWPLLFEGEIVADSFSKSPTNRSHTFHCAGYHTYWEQVLFYFYDAGTNFTTQTPWTQKMAVALGNSEFKIDGSVAGANLRQRLVAEIKEHAKKGYNSIAKTVFGDVLDTNHFFRISNQALKLNQRFVTPKDPNVDLLIGRSLLREAMDLDILAVSGQQSMMEVLRGVLDTFRYQIIHNAQPSLLSVEKRERRTAAQIEKDVADIQERIRQLLAREEVDDHVVDHVVKTIDGKASEPTLSGLVSMILNNIDKADDEQLKKVFTSQFLNYNIIIAKASNPTVNGDGQLEENEKGEDLLAQFLLLPDTRFALPPTCNVFFPHDQTAFSLDRQLMQEPTRGISVATQEGDLPLRMYMAPPEIDQAVIPSVQVPPVSVVGTHPPLAKGNEITSNFQQARVIKNVHINPRGKARKHSGIDLAAPVGENVYAFDNGIVERSGWENRNDEKQGYGQRIYIRHDNGMVTRYAHLSQLLVQSGERVVAGQVIGKVGNTGGSTGPHLHFETWVRGRPENPRNFLKLTANGKFLAPPSEDPVDDVEIPETDEGKITDKPLEKGGKFYEHQYLTPEEQIRGIVPFFDIQTSRSHSLLSFQQEAGEVDQYLRQLIYTEFFFRRFQSRNLGALTGPFNPSPVAGFPGLALDKNRPIIGHVASVSHNISVGGGSGNASTTVQMEAPRYWDEGDPYFWDQGREQFTSRDGREVPDPDVAHFPAYYLSSLVATNSVEEGEEWKPSKATERPIDKLYASLLGPSVRGIPYRFATRSTNMGTVVAYNDLIATRPGEAKKTTLLDHYYDLVKAKDPDISDLFVRSFTRRLGVSERELMVDVLGCSTQDRGLSYVGPAFRTRYQETVRRLNAILNENSAIRG